MKLESILAIILLGVLLTLLIVPPIYTVKKRHEKNLIYATTKKIEETAENCYHQEICQNTKITLRELYDYELLEPIANPITKEYYNEASYVTIKNYKGVFTQEKTT